MTNTMDDYARQLVQSHDLREAAVRDVIRRLELPRGSHGLDAGCGIGLQLELLLQAIGDDGRMTGLDLSADLLRHAERRIGERGLAPRIALRQGDVGSLPFEDDTFDWAWSMDCVGYHSMDPMPALQELRRVVRPGGQLVLLMWSGQRLLPGYPLLEARLSASPDGIASWEERPTPGRHYLRALGWLRELGLTAPHADTVVGTVTAPCSAEMRASLQCFFEMLWSKAQTHLSKEDGETLRAITDPQSPDYIVDSPDYFGFYTYTMFVGLVAAAG